MAYPLGWTSDTALKDYMLGVVNLGQQLRLNLFLTPPGERVGPVGEVAKPALAELFGRDAEGKVTLTALNPYVTDITEGVLGHKLARPALQWRDLGTAQPRLVMYTPWGLWNLGMAEAWAPAGDEWRWAIHKLALGMMEDGVEPAPGRSVLLRVNRTGYGERDPLFIKDTALFAAMGLRGSAMAGIHAWGEQAGRAVEANPHDVRLWAEVVARNYDFYEDVRHARQAKRHGVGGAMVAMTPGKTLYVGGGTVQMEDGGPEVEQFR